MRKDDRGLQSRDPHLPLRRRLVSARTAARAPSCRRRRHSAARRVAQSWAASRPLLAGRCRAQRPSLQRNAPTAISNSFASGLQCHYGHNERRIRSDWGQRSESAGIDRHTRLNWHRAAGDSSPTRLWTQSLLIWHSRLEELLVATDGTTRTVRVLQVEVSTARRHCGLSSVSSLALATKAICLIPCCCSSATCSSACCTRRISSTQASVSLSGAPLRQPRVLSVSGKFLLTVSAQRANKCCSSTRTTICYCHSVLGIST